MERKYPIENRVNSFRLRFVSSQSEREETNLTTGEAGLVPLVSSGDHFFGSIDGLSAFSALGNIWGFERHDDLVIGFVRGWTLK